jgi:hypothetical protein
MRAHLLQAAEINLSRVLAGQTVGIAQVDDHLLPDSFVLRSGIFRR